MSRLLLVFFVVTLSFATCDAQTQVRLLVFSKTKGFRHSSIPAGIEAIKKLVAHHNILVDTTENAAQFTSKNLKKYKAVIFLNTTGDVLNNQQQEAFEAFIRKGGGFVGIHAATDTEYNWPWYNNLVGAYFNGHPNDPNVRTADFLTVNPNHLSTTSLPTRFKRTDEFYDFKSFYAEVKVLVEIDEKTYEGGTHGQHHPMSWYHEYDGGRAFYTAMGHTEESFSEDLFLQHLWGGIKYAMGE